MGVYIRPEASRDERNYRLFGDVGQPQCLSEEEIDRLRNLPMWARSLIYTLGSALDEERRASQRLQQAHDLLTTHEWVPIANNGPGRTFHLFTLFPDRAFPVCTLYERDILMIGRVKPEEHKL